MFPQNLINSEKRDTDWVKEVAKYIITTGTSEFYDEQVKDTKCWNIYHGITNNTKFKYLTDVEGFTYPAKMRNIGNEIVRSKLNVLEAKQMRRQFRFRAFAMDERSLQKKYENRIKAYLTSVKEMYEERNALLQSQIQQVQDRMNDMQEQLKVQPENAEMQQQMQQLKANMPVIQLEFNKIIRVLSREALDTQQLQEKIDYFILHSEQEVMQQIANAAVKSAIQTEDLQEHWNIGMREKITTGKPTYITYYDGRRDDIFFKQIDASSVYYNRNGNNKWIHNGEWCFTEEYMSDSQVRSEFELTKDESEILNAFSTGNMDMLRNYNGNSAYFDAVEEVNNQRFGGHRVQRIWFLAPREIFYRKSPNKYREGEYFYHLTEKDSKLKKDEKRNRIVIYDLYHCVIIANTICINMGKQDKVFRPLDIPGLPTLPIVGRTFNNLSEKPYSLIWRVRELIELYDIVNYKKELTIVLAGVKGMIMDKSQKPDNMSEKKWMYYRKLGTMWIETMKKGRKNPPSYNQFQNYDDTIGESIAFLDNVLIGIENMIGKVMGLTDAIQGQFVSKDPVANVKMSNEQSSLITEVLFAENDSVFNKALELYTNLKMRYVWNKGKVLNLINKDLEEVLIQIPKGMLEGADFRFYSSNNIKEDTLIEDLRQGAFQAWAKNELPFSSIISVFKIDDITEMEHQLEKIMKEADQIRQQNAEATENARGQVDQQTAQLKGQIDAQLEGVKNEMKAADLEIKKATLQFEAQKFAWESQFKEKELKIKSNLDVMKTQSENEIESAYLQEEGRSNRTQEMLKQFELKMNAILQEMGIKASEMQSVRKASVDMDKNMRNKNNIKD
jgi:hypothetical protein